MPNNNNETQGDDDLIGNESNNKMNGKHGNDKASAAATFGDVCKCGSSARISVK